MGRVRGLLSVGLATLAMALLAPAAWAFKCDVDNNGFVDLRDLALIQQAVLARAPVTGPDDPRDADTNGVINSIDGRLCALRCKYAKCASNGAPLANAGPDQTVHVTDRVTLTGAASSDPDGDPLRYTWTMLSRPAGSTAALADATTVNPSFSADRPGSYVVQLAVNDGKAGSATDSVVISTENSAPTAHAGPDQTVFVTGAVTLDGRLSSDVDGDALSYTWGFVSKPPGSFAALSDPGAVQPQFIVDLPGAYHIQLVVSDGRLQSRADLVIVSTQNSPPVARLGSDRSVPLGSIVQMDGSGSFDVDGDRLGFAWALISQPAGSAAALSDRTAVAPRFNADRTGVYVVQLIVNDGSSNSAPASITITTENAAPTARAGPDQTVPLGAAVQLDGSTSSDPEGAGLTYTWALTTRPAGSAAVLDNPGAANPRFAADRPGTYIAQLIVSDGSLASAPDTVVISTENSRPVADAGQAQNVATGGKVQLDGSASRDADGDGLSYAWALTTRPAGSNAAVSDASAVRPTFVADKEGDYVVQLIVSDGRLASAPTTVTIRASTPNRAPVAVAIANPSNPVVGATVNLDGSGSSDPDGDGLSYAWTLVAKPAGSNVVITDAATAIARFVPDMPGSYSAQLRVSDGRLSHDALTTVVASPVVINRPPIARDDSFTIDEGSSIALPGAPAPAGQLPSIAGHRVAVYATLDAPVQIAFDASGALYVGYGVVGTQPSDPNDSGIVRRIAWGGSPAVNFGPLMTDPDAVVVDVAGAIASVPGAVLVSGTNNDGTASHLTALHPDGTARRLFEVPVFRANASAMVVDPAGRLLIADGGSTPADPHRVLVSTGGIPITLFTVPAVPQDLAVDADGRIVTAGADGVIRVHASDGSVIHPSLVSGLGITKAVAFGNGGAFGMSLHVIDGQGRLLRVDPAGAVSVLGTGLDDAIDMVFGPDHALYVSDYVRGRILRVTPNESSTSVGGVLDNDSDPDGDSLSAVLLTQPANGSLSFASTGAFGYAPRAGFQGTDTFTYKASDAQLDSNVATVTITVRPVNHPPVFATAPPLTATTGQRYVYDANAFDPDAGDVLAFSLTSAPPGMTISLASGVVTWDPSAAQAGPHPVMVRVADPGGLFAEQAFTITVARGNTAPAFTSSPVTDHSVGRCANPAGASWATRAPLTTPRYFPGSATVGGHLFMVGGCTSGNCGGDVTATVEAYDSGADAWTQRSPMSVARGWLAAAEIAGRVYAVGGNTSAGPSGALNRLEVFDPVANTWATLPPMPTARTALMASAMGGKLYVVGGLDGVANTSIAAFGHLEVFDPANNTWTTLSPMPTPRASAAAGVIDGKLFVVGGLDASRGVLSSLEVYDPATDTWTTKTPMPTARVAPGFAVVDGKLVVAGGSTASSLLPFAVFDVVEVYDPASDTWSALPKMPTARYGPASSFVGGRLNVVGGTITEPLTVNEALCQGIIPYRYDSNATDADGDPISFALQQGPQGMTIDPQSGLINWTPTQQQLGSHSVTVRASDGLAFTDQSFTVAVLNPNRAPTIEFAGLDPQWTKLAPAGPAPAARYAVGSAYDVVNDRLIVFGGGDSASAPLNEVWVLANAAGRAGLPEWSRLAPSGALPPARALASTVYDPTANRLIIRGGCPPGCHTPIIVDTWVLTNANGLGGAPQWIQLPAGNADFGAGHAYDPVSNRLMVLGGLTSGGPFTDTNVTRVLIDGNGIGDPQWITLSPTGTAPPPRSELQGLGYDSTHNRLIVFGGYRWRDIDYNDVWVLKNANGLGGTAEWQQLLPAGEGPAPRANMSSHYDPNSNRLIVFGGLRQSSNPDQIFGDTWVLSNANGLGGVPTWTQLQLPRVNPGPRRSHATVYDPQSNRLVMAFGEYDTAASPIFADAWVQDNASGNCTAGRRCAFRIIASDPNAGDPLTYALQSGPDGLLLNPSTGDMQWTPTIAQIGDHTVTVRVMDGEGLFATQSFTASVAAVAVPNVVGLAPEWAESFITAADLTVGARTTRDGAVKLRFDSLPSRQAWTFGGSGFDDAPSTEEALFRVDGNVLYQDTTGVGGRALGYAMTRGVDARLPLTLAVRARVTGEEAATPLNRYGFGFDAWTGSSLLGNNLFGVGLGTDAILVGDAPSNTVLPFDNTGFHEYVMFARPGISISLTIDGAPFHAGLARVFPAVPSYALALGDLTRGPNARAEVTAYSFTQPRVVGQSPPAGTLVPNKTPVDLIIVDGPATETVPSVIGLAQSAATAAITATKLVLGQVTSAPHPSIPAGQVADQSPLPGIKVPPSTPVAIVMSTGPPANVAPVITSAPVLAARVGQAYAYAVMATDANGDTLNYTLPQAPAGMVIDAATGLISWTPAAGQVGPQSVTVSVTDLAGLSAAQPFTITVSPAPQPPSFTSTPVNAAAVGLPYSYDADATDPDAGDTLSYSLAVAPAGMSIATATGLIAWNPTAAQLGLHPVTVRVTDPGGLFAEQSFIVTVAPAPRAPAFTSTPITTATAGQPYVYDADATDSDVGDTLNYTLPTAPAGMAIDAATGLITWTPAASQVGIHPVSVRVQDPGGLFALQDYTVTVAAAQACAAPAAGLQSWWPGEGSGTDRANINHAAAEAGAGLAAGRVGQAFRFDGLDDQLRVAHSRTTGFAGPFSIEFWFNPAAAIGPGTPNQVLLAKGRYLEGGFNAPLAIQVLGGDGRLLVRMPPAPALISTTATWPADTWQHVALTWDGARYRLYVNGGEEAGLDNTFSIIDSTDPITLGNADGFAGAGFAGLLDEVSLYGRALGPTEVAALHVAGGLGKCTTTYSRADAGADQAVGLGAAVTLDGSASRAFDGAALAYQWQLVTRPANSAAVLSDATAVQPAFTADREGDYVAELIVTNAGRASAPDRVRITATNHPPQINSVAPISATAGAPYSYAVIATDPDPGVLAYTLPQAPAGMTISAAGLVQWTPTDAQVGSQAVTVRVTDPSGLIAEQAFTITVLLRPQQVAVPNLAGLEETAARAALIAANLVTGNVTTASSDTVPAGRVISHSPIAGTLVPRGSAVDLVVSSGPPQPTVVAIRVTPQTPLILTGQSQAFTATGILSNGASLPLSTGLTWTSSNPAVAGINAAGVAGALTSGTSTITVSQGAASGSTTLAVEQAVADGALPVAQITSPTDGASVATAVPVVGTATDANFLKYVLEIAPFDTGDFSTIATGTSPVANGTLGTLDPTTLVNDLYVLRLTVIDKADNRTATEISVQVTREKKVGAFTLAFQDVNVPVAGIPISVVRSYDSRDKARGDFGIGWRLDVNSLRLRVTGVLGQGWQQVRSGGVLNRRYDLVATRTHKVAITLPDGKVEEFDMTVSPSSQQLVPIQVVDTGFSPRPNTVGSLRALGETRLVTQGAVGPLDLFTENGFEIFNPQAFEYTTPEGQVITLSRTQGVTQIRDRNGNTVSFGPGGILHSAGKSISFARDAQGRITSVTDPLGQVQTYAYDINGDLASHTDALGNRTGYLYNFSHGLIDIIDPRGVKPIRNDYDAAGRLIGTTDAFGKTITYTHDLGANREVITDRLGNQTIHVYDDQGNVTQSADALGGVTTRSYDGRGNTLTETDPLGRTRTYTYDGQDNRLTETDPLGKVTRYTYNGTRQVLTVTDALGRVTTNAYDGAGNLTQSTDAAGAITRYTYDARGLQTTRTDPAGNVTRYAHDAAGHLASETDALGRVTSYTHDAGGNRLTQTTTRTVDGTSQLLSTTFVYDANNRLTQTTHPDGSVTRTTYNAIGKQDKTTDALGRETRYEYDAMGRLARTTYPDGSSESSTYDAEGRRSASTDRAGRSTTYAYDALGRLTATTFADGAGTATAYDAAGQVSASTDARGNVTAYQYDAAGRRTRVTDATSAATQFFYDDLGNQVRVLDANGNAVQFQYDANNRRTRTTYADGTSDQVAYDALGRQVAKTDQAGITTQYGYDALGRLIRVTDALGQVTSYSYDEQGNQLTQTDAEGRTTSFAYDSMGRRIRRTLPLGMSEHMSYDAAGNLVTKTDFNGKTTRYAYDSVNRLLAKTPDASLAGQAPIAFSYTPSGQRATMSDASGLTSYSYDSRDRLLTKATPQGTLNYSHDAAGNVIRIRSARVGGADMSYAWDARNRLASVTDANGATTYRYDLAGNLQSFLYPNGVEHRYTYNALNRLTNLTGAKGATTIASYTYTLGPAGNRTGVTEANGRRMDYSYDALYRLTGETISADPSGPNGAIGYVYDRVGNRLARTSTVAGIDAQVFAYDANDRITTESYDDNGSTLGSGGRTFGYDFENRLVSADGGVSFVYNGDGIRVGKTAGGVTTAFLVDDRNPTGYAQVVEEVVGGAVERSYTWGLKLVSQKQAAGVSFYGFDGHGSVRELTSATADVANAYSYDAFGNNAVRIEQLINRYGYAGEQFDSNIDAYYLRARYYRTRHGRLISVDSAAFDASAVPPLHPYTYSGNDPINRIDPSGNYFISVIAATAVLYAVADFAVTAYVNRSEGILASQGPPRGASHLSISGREFIKRRELPPNGTPVPATVYNDHVGFCTAGWGHLVHYPPKACDGSEPANLLDGVSLAEAEQLLDQDVQTASYWVGRFVNVPLAQYEFDAIVDFTFNAGGGGLQRSNTRNWLNRGLYQYVPRIIRFDRIRNDPIGLGHRRRLEGILFGSAEYR